MENNEPAFSDDASEIMQNYLIAYMIKRVFLPSLFSAFLVVFLMNEVKIPSKPVHGKSQEIGLFYRLPSPPLNMDLIAKQLEYILYVNQIWSNLVFTTYILALVYVEDRIKYARVGRME